jgi:hypothetical protein
MQTICHDFKSPRNDTARRLPSIFMLVPIMFYVGLLAGGYFGATSYMTYRQDTLDRDIWTQQRTDHEATKAGIEAEKAAVDTEKKKAEKLAQWVEGTRTLQPITVAVARSIPPEISLGEMTLERSPELPQQIFMGVKINNGTLEEVGRIQNAVGALSYRSYNSQQTKAADGLDFRTLLVWQQF